jgi:hypothetical protein
VERALLLQLLITLLIDVGGHVEVE